MIVILVAKRTTIVRKLLVWIMIFSAAERINALPRPLASIEMRDDAPESAYTVVPAGSKIEFYASPTYSKVTEAFYE